MDGHDPDGIVRLWRADVRLVVRPLLEESPDAVPM